MVSPATLAAHDEPKHVFQVRGWLALPAEDWAWFLEFAQQKELKV